MYYSEQQHFKQECELQQHAVIQVFLKENQPLKPYR